MCLLKPDTLECLWQSQGLVIAGFIQSSRWEGTQWRPARWHSNVRRSPVTAVFGRSVSGRTSCRQVSLGHACISLSLQRPAQRRIIQHCTPPLHFAYVKFGGCDWPIFSRWMPVQTSLTEVNIDIAECMNNVYGTSTMPYKVMRIDLLRWISLIIRRSLDLIVRAETITPSLYDSLS